MIEKLTQMRRYLGVEKTELLSLSDSTLGKLWNMSDKKYAAIDLLPDFGE